MAGYDMIPWKLAFCDRPWGECTEAGFSIKDLPSAPEPGRIPEEADHVHVRAKFSADQRDARGDHLWRTLLLCTTRCEHGRTQGDRCFSCPTGYAPSKAGQRVGFYLDGVPLIVPERHEQNDIAAWKRGFHKKGPQ